jgi:hypothetical protein
VEDQADGAGRHSRTTRCASTGLAPVVIEESVDERTVLGQLVAAELQEVVTIELDQVGKHRLVRAGSQFAGPPISRASCY